MIGTASTAGGAVGSRNLGWAVPLAPIALSGFLLSATTWLRVHGGGGDGLFSALVAGCYELFGFEPFFMFNLLVLTWSSIWFLTGTLERPGTRVLKVAGLCLCLAILVNLRADGTLPYGSGDIGAFVATRLQSALGYGPSTILVAIAAFAALLLATDYFFYRHFEALGRRPGSGFRLPDDGVEDEAVEGLKGPLSIGPTIEPRAAFAVATAGAPAELETQIRAEDLEIAFDDVGADVEIDQDVAELVAGDVGVTAGDGDGASVASEGEDEIAVATVADVEEHDDAPAGPEAVANRDGAEVEGARLAGEDEGYEDEGYEDEDYDDDYDEDDEDDEDVDEESDEDVDDEEYGEEYEDEEDEGAEDDDEDDDEDVESAAAEPIDAEPTLTIPRPSDVPEDDEPADDAARRQGALFGPAATADDELLDEATQLVVEYRRASANFLRRRLRVSHEEAIEILSALHARGVIEYEVGATHGRVIAEA